MVPSSRVLQPEQFRGLAFTALCSSKFELNVNLTRVPQLVPEVKCAVLEVAACQRRCRGGCKQLYSELLVKNYVIGEQGQKYAYSQFTRFRAGCVCELYPAAAMAQQVDLTIS